MSTGFTVDIEQLRAMITKLQAGQTAMEEARTLMSKVSPELAGTDPLDNAIDDFQQRWGYGLSQIKKDIEATLEGLDEVLQVYAEVDKALADMYRAQLAALAPK